MNSEYEIAKQTKLALENSADEISKELKKYPRGDMGLTLDSAKDERWHNLKREYDKANKAVGNFNRQFLKKYKKEWRRELQEKRFGTK